MKDSLPSRRAGLRVLLLLTAGILLSACAGAPEMEEDEPTPTLDETAQAALKAGQYREAAQRFLELAESADPPQRHTYRLRAANALVSGHALAEARALLADTDVTGQPENVRALKATVGARIALAEYRPYDALAELQRYVGESLPAVEEELLRRTLAEAHAEAGNPVEAARARVGLELYLTDSGELSQNRWEIWAQLTRLQPAVLIKLSPAPPDTLAGWMQLAAMARVHATSFADLSAALPEWRSRFPGHPANESVLPELLERLRYAVTDPKHIALLLPQEGRFAGAAAAVRDGFVAAWFDAQNTANAPVVSVYDASPATLWSVYQEAVQNGADFIVGPLDRESVSLLAMLDRLPVPTLALNQAQEKVSEAPSDVPSDAPADDPDAGQALDSTSSPGEPTDEGTAAQAQNTPADARSDRPTLGLYQFALSPEGEAERVAERAWLDGHTRAAVIRPDTAWGTRVAAAFNDAWLALGGEIAEEQVYGKEDQEIASAIKRMLNVDESQKRARQLRWTLAGDLKYEPRRRQDVDLVFMAAFPRQARQIRPQLKFHRASDVAVYATSHAYPGSQDRERDRDVDGVVFGDMPWLLAPETADPTLHSEIKTHWHDSADRYNRLYAFGIDAYRLIPHLGRLRTQPYADFEGVTGRIGLDTEGKVQRDLVWAQFRGGRPRLLPEPASR